jgi:serine O-acetyltransferase
MKNVIKHDLFRYNKLSGYRGLLRGMMIPGFRFMFFLRLASQYQNKNSIKRIFYKLILRKYVVKYGIQIPASTEIGEGFYIGHFGNIVVSANAKIGKNCNIAHGVTIGQTNRGKKKGAPVIGDQVWIGTGSVIVGKVTIGNNVLIAPLSYINFDVPGNSLVLGNPAKIVKKDNPTEGYINNILL